MPTIRAQLYANVCMYTCANVKTNHCLDEDLMYLHATGNSVLQYVAVCCSVLQCVAVCCKTNHCLDEDLMYLHATGKSKVCVCVCVLQCTVECCRGYECVLQSGVVYCSVLQCAASWVSLAKARSLCLCVLKCTAECCI